ncbi:hypothetical protein MBLNU457_6439t1 [Dothideomycetes sp. NU457]
MHIPTSPPTRTLPAYANSVSGLTYIGFNPSTSSIIYNRWLNRRASNPDSFWDYITGHICTINIASLLNKTDRQRMTATGLQQCIQDAILDERFETIFRTVHLQHWIRDTLDINYRELCTRRPVDEEEESEDVALRALVAAEAGDGDVHCASAESGESDIVRPTITLAQGQTPSSLPPALLQRCTLTPEPPPVPPGHTALYKACAVPTLIEGCPHVLDDDSSVHLSALADWDSIGDFHSGWPATYWVPDRGVAELYREYIAARCAKAATCVVRVLVPDTWLAGVKVQSLLGDEGRWKESVVQCRRGRGMFHEEEGVLERADVVVGYVCTVDRRFWGRTFKDVQAATVAVDPLKTEDGRKAVQWCFDRGRAYLSDAVQGKLHFDVFEEEERVEEREREEMGRYTMEMSWA